MNDLYDKTYHFFLHATIHWQKFIKHRLSFTLKDTEKDEIIFQNYLSPGQKKVISSISKIVSRHSLLTFSAIKTFLPWYKKIVAAERNDVSL